MSSVQVENPNGRAVSRTNPLEAASQNLNQHTIIKGSQFGVANVFDIAGQATKYIPYEFPNEKVFVAFRFVSFKDLGSAGVDMDMRTYEDVTINTPGNPLNFLNSDRNEPDSSAINAYDTTSVVDTTGATELEPTFFNIISDRKTNIDNVLEFGYIPKTNSTLAIEFTNNNDVGTTRVSYKAIISEGILGENVFEG